MAGTWMALGPAVEYLRNNNALEDKKSKAGTWQCVKVWTHACRHVSLWTCVEHGLIMRRRSHLDDSQVERFVGDRAFDLKLVDRVHRGAGDEEHVEKAVVDMGRRRSGRHRSSG